MGEAEKRASKVRQLSLLYYAARSARSKEWARRKIEALAPFYFGKTEVTVDGEFLEETADEEEYIEDEEGSPDY